MSPKKSLRSREVGVGVELNFKIRISDSTFMPKSIYHPIVSLYVYIYDLKEKRVFIFGGGVRIVIFSMESQLETKKKFSDIGIRVRVDSILPTFDGYIKRL